MKYSKEAYEQWFDPCSGDDTQYDVRRRGIVKTRVPHLCQDCLLLRPHTGKTIEQCYHPAGTMMWKDDALFNHCWHTLYICTPCIDPWLDELLAVGYNIS